MNEFVIKKNKFLHQDIKGFYYTEYIGYRKQGNPDFINDLKNTYNSFSKLKLDNAVAQLKTVLEEMLIRDLGYTATICVVPRAKTNYSPNQLLFKSTVKSVIQEVIDEIASAQYYEILADGTDYITRIKNTKTTHLPANTPNYNNDGSIPYPGITKDTCNISKEVSGKDIILIDDIYTYGVNIDEDAIQALLDNNAKSVLFYAIGKTTYRH